MSRNTALRYTIPGSIITSVIRRPFGQWLRSPRNTVRSSFKEMSSTVLVWFTMMARFWSAAFTCAAGDAPPPATPADAGEPRAVVLALPRGGVPVAAEVARALGVPLDILLVRKLGHPEAPELGLGAVPEGGRVRCRRDTLRGGARHLMGVPDAGQN